MVPYEDKVIVTTVSAVYQAPIFDDHRLPRGKRAERMEKAKQCSKTSI